MSQCGFKNHSCVRTLASCAQHWICSDFPPCCSERPLWPLPMFRLWATRFSDAAYMAERRKLTKVGNGRSLSTPLHRAGASHDTRPALVVNHKSPAIAIRHSNTQNVQGEIRDRICQLLRFHCCLIHTHIFIPLPTRHLHCYAFHGVHCV